MSLPLLYTLFSLCYSEKVVAHCKNVKNNTCTLCSKNYILSKEGQCISEFDLHCSYRVNGVCLLCHPGYQINITTRNCVVGDELCTSWSYPNSFICQECVSGYTLLNQNRCENCSSIQRGCLRAFGDCSRCYTCQDGYYLENEKCKRVANCRVFDSNRKCTLCIAGYYFDLESNTCERGNISKCIFYQNKTVCGRCTEGLVQIGNSCVEVDHCIETDGQQCSLCELGYSLNNSKCEKCKDSNCATCIVNKDMCTICLSEFRLTSQKTCLFCNESIGYKMFQDKCVKCDSSCKSCELHSPQICTECVGTSVLKNGKCIQCEDGCKSCNSENVSICEECLDGFIMNLDSNTCVKCSGNCSTCQFEDTSQCISCLPGYYFSEDQKNCFDCSLIQCSELNSKEKCDSCSSKCKTSGIDFKNCFDVNCLDYNNERNVCVECKNGYYVDDNYSCLQCDQKCGENGCVKFKDFCLLPPKQPNCVIEMVDKKCKQCSSQSFSVQNGVCEKRGFCFNRNDNGNCTACSYSLNGRDVFYEPFENGLCNLLIDPNVIINSSALIFVFAITLIMFLFI
ncbi:hypothetical protein EIN_450560 [Entamoeba invadens IP1]|uniref:EGF-like domain-containing protein n=1 Tax=Entamoeba invadens IP1 TaxID=370355 RepID=A0A0A1TXE8_ENTIV|nr:hypothetical protein EIN_450560 [Entamoeba invadens IP1]ELP85997.1 hypothetical protein EIN_450560 [Entamoeba invadens IP1]|eukprot:XP_004185343.1 hypothetical protein EIN_450560 [Entamoeba invadens IP1]